MARRLLEQRRAPRRVAGALSAWPSASLSFAVLWLAVLASACASGRRAQVNAPRPERGAVVSEHPLATEVGVELLEAGGNAADAAVGVAMALAVVYPQAGNLGGGGFALWVPHGDPDRAAALDFREVAPTGLVPQHFLGADGRPDPELSLSSPFAVGVPGTPAGLEAFHKRFGRLSFREVLAPAIRLARDGYPVDPWLARDLRDPVFQRRLGASPAAAQLWFPRGVPLREGALAVQPDLARTLERLAELGAARGFYRGPVAEALLGELGAGQGALAAADLESYEPRWRDPSSGWFRGRLVLTFPPPSSGGVLLLQFLAVLDGFPLEADRQRAQEGRTDDGWTDPQLGFGARTVHWWIEAMRRGFADRAEHLGDPDHVDVPVAQLLAPSWIAMRRVSIGDRAAPDVRPLVLGGGAESTETTHLCVLDGDGNAVSLTTTLNSTFGSGRMAAGTGFLLNNEIDDFAIFPGVPNDYGLVGSAANRLVGGKRPLSSMTPTVVLDEAGAVRLVVGSPGGPRIISAVAQVLLRHVAYGQPIDAAVRAPRVHQQWRPTVTYLEPGWSTGLASALEERGHEVEIAARRWASVQAIAVEPGREPTVASDPRRGGTGAVVGREASRPSRPADGP